MKHLKKFNEESCLPGIMSGEISGEYFKKYINFDIINLAKEESLEYLDQGYILRYKVYIEIEVDMPRKLKNKNDYVRPWDISKTEDRFNLVVLIGRYSHYDDSLFYPEDIPKSVLSYNSKINIRYQFYIISGSGIVNINICSYESKELVSYLRDCYPKENIDIY